MEAEKEKDENDTIWWGGNWTWYGMHYCCLKRVKGTILHYSFWIWVIQKVKAGPHMGYFFLLLDQSFFFFFKDFEWLDFGPLNNIPSNHTAHQYLQNLILLYSIVHSLMERFNHRNYIYILHLVSWSIYHLSFFPTK